jgi:predicted dehydrogenase
MFVRNEMFLAEVRHFLDCLHGGKESLISVVEGARSLAVALAAKVSLNSGQAQSVARV